MRGVHRKRFRGQIATIERPDLALDVELWVEDRGLTIARKDKPLGTWPIQLVHIERVASSRFVITLDGEHCAFVARDPIAFSYEGIKAINSARQKVRRGLRKRRKDPIPSLQAILVARVQGLEPADVIERVEAASPVPPAEIEPVPIETRKPEHRPARRRTPAPVAADPYATEAAPSSPIPSAAVDDPPEPATGARKQPGVLERVRNARNGIVHEHVYTEHSASAGLLRRVCNECGHVSIDISE